MFAESPTPGPGPTTAPRRERSGEPARLLRELARGLLVMDAGMGTRLLARGLNLRRSDPALWNLDRPQEVLEVHRRDAAAGARVLLTNTFGASRAWLSRSGRVDVLGPINRAGADLARRAIGPSGFVLGDIGPWAAEMPGAAAEQAAILVDAGVDALILETFRLGPALAVLAELRPIREASAVPAIVSLWEWPEAVEDAANRLVDAGADVIGANCRPAPVGLRPLVRRLAGAVACPLMVKPGVAPGDPEPGATPDAFADVVPDLVRHNVRLIGGCCGTTEAHVAALALACTSLLRDPETQERRGTAP